MSMRLAIVVCASFFLLHPLTGLGQAAAELPVAHTEASMQLQRQYYTAAKTALDAGNTTQYRTLKRLLTDYPLLPYLEYQELNKQLARYPYNQVDRFLDKHNNTYLGNLLLRKWLSQLASAKRWHEYRSYFSPELTSTAHQCLFIWSRIQTGDKSALQNVERLWNVGKSQADECDPVFKQWQQAGYLTENLIWERYLKASLRKQTRLKRYLKRLMSAPTLSMASQFEQILIKPTRLENRQKFQPNHPYQKQLVFHGLNKYIRNNADSAGDLWEHYDAQYQFSAKEKNQFIYKLAKRHAFDDKAPQAEQYLDQLNNEQKSIVKEIVIRKKLKSSDWPEINRWIALLPDEQKFSERWQYWQARSHESLGKPEILYLPIYRKLAQNRSFYGFLSADYLNQEYNLQHSPTTVQQEIRKQLASKPAMLRARELFFLNKFHDARREWAYATQNTSQPLSPEAHQASAQIAYEWGWYRKSIEAMAAAAAWDDLDIRFPIAHEALIQQQANQSNLPATLLFAIARQESAWESDARSSAGAMGLMQLMPQTAKETAKKAGISHRRDDLLKPEHNIALGSRYIGELLDKYDNNRVPAIAAYNAGPHRVNKWLEKTDSLLPYDVWIEVIPFNETRKYVQNVLSYAVVYAHQTGNTSPLLTQIEINRSL